MTVSHKSSSTKSCRLMVYKRALHPELFKLEGRNLQRHGDYEGEMWICRAGHVVRFQTEGHVMTEAVVEDGDHLPEHGLISALPCLGEKEYEHPRDAQHPIGFVPTIQTEFLTENLYMATYREMMDFATENNSLFHTWADNEGANCLSLLDVQTFKCELHVQSYHLSGIGGLVLRTQSIFEAC